MNIENLNILADYLDKVSPDSFNMREFYMDKYGKSLGISDAPLSHECGSAACAVGFGPAAGIKVPETADGWMHYSCIVFFNKPNGYLGFGKDNLWDYLFSSNWGNRTDPQDTARRIRYMISKNFVVPDNFREQISGLAKKSY